MKKGYDQSERDAAVRCVECPACKAAVGNRCVLVRRSPGTRFRPLPTVTHKSRVDKYYNDTYGPDSPAVKELLEKAEAGRRATTYSLGEP